MALRARLFWAIKVAVLVGFSGMIPLAGCSLDRLGHEEVASALQRYVDEAPEAGARYGRLPGVSANGLESPGQTGDVAGDVRDSHADSTLRSLLIVALRENPDIQVAEEQARAAAERIAQVTALPDPIVSGKWLPEPVRTAEGDNPFILGVRQPFPVPEKLDRAGRIALEKTHMALARVQETRLRVIADVKRAYFHLYMVIKSIEITQENQQLLHGLIDVTRAQLAAGKRPQEDVLRATVELSNLEATLIRLRQDRLSTEARLNRLLGRNPGTPVPEPVDFAIRDSRLSIDILLAKAAKANPSLKRLEHQIARDREAVGLARVAYWPNFTVGLEWMIMDGRSAFEPPRNPATGRRPPSPQLSEDGSDNWAILFGFTLPIWGDKIRAGVREAELTVAASTLQYSSARDRLEFEIEDALARVRAQQELATLFKSTIIPQAGETYRVSLASYSAGSSDFLYVIDNWRKWLTFTIQYYRSLGELERSVADLEQAVGLSLTDLDAES